MEVIDVIRVLLEKDESRLFKERCKGERSIAYIREVVQNVGSY